MSERKCKHQLPLSVLKYKFYYSGMVRSRDGKLRDTEKCVTVHKNKHVLSPRVAPESGQEAKGRRAKREQDPSFTVVCPEKGRQGGSRFGFSCSEWLRWALGQGG